MAHEIRFNDRFGEVRKNGQRAWHGLGLEIEEGLSAETAFPLIGLDWETELAPIYAETFSINGVNRIELPEHRAHIRRDTNEVLGVVSEGFKALENMELARFSDALAGADAAVTVETAGSLYGGRRVFSLVKLPEVVKASADDVMELYVLVANGHGGTAAFSVYPTSVRVVCANTLRWSERDAAKGCKFRHTGNFEEKIASARLALGIARDEAKKFQEQVSALVGIGLTKAKAKEIYQQIWEKCFGKLSHLEGDTLIKMTAKRDVEVERCLELIEAPRQTIAGISGSAWAGYNAMSEWLDHERGRFKGVGESDARVASNLFGVAQIHKLRAYRSFLELAR